MRTLGNKSNADPSAQMDVRAELERAARMVDELKVLFEQYFSGVIPLQPEQPHQEIKRLIRRLRKAPFKNSEGAYRLRMLEQRYNTLNTYWMRVLREKEEGTYFKDIFKAEVRQRQAEEEAYAQTAEGKASKGMETLFRSYKSALEKMTGKEQQLDYQAFHKSLVARAKELKERHGIKKLSFKVVVRDGKVTVQARPKEQ